MHRFQQLEHATRLHAQLEQNFEKIQNKTKELTYGELTTEGVLRLSEYWHLHAAASEGPVRVYDLGSGEGKLCILLALLLAGAGGTSAPLDARVAGIEIVESRHSEAVSSLQLAVENGWMVPDEAQLLRFEAGDAFSMGADEADGSTPSVARLTR